MKPVFSSGLVGAFLLGAVAGLLVPVANTSVPPGIPAARPSLEARLDLPAGAANSRNPEEVRPPRTLPPILAGEIAGLPASRQALRLVFDRLPRESIQSGLGGVVPGHAARERRAFEAFQAIQDPGDLEVLKDLLECITDPGVRAEVAVAVRAETDPHRRRLLASIVGGIWQHSDFTPLVLDLLQDPDPEVVRAALKETNLMRIQFEKNPEWMRRAARLMRAAASVEKPIELRAQALRSMRGTEDPQDTRFLLDMAVRDRHEGIGVAAIGSLSDSYEMREAHGELVKEMVKVLFYIAVDASRPMQVREAAAIQADMIDWNEEDLILSPAERAALSAIRGW